MHGKLLKKCLVDFLFELIRKYLENFQIHEFSEKILKAILEESLRKYMEEYAEKLLKNPWLSFWRNKWRNSWKNPCIISRTNSRSYFWRDSVYKMYLAFKREKSSTKRNDPYTNFRGFIQKKKYVIGERGLAKGTSIVWHPWTF